MSAKHPKRPRDANQLAKMVVDIATGAKNDFASAPDSGTESEAVTLGRMGGLKGGRIRAERLTPDQRREIAQRAAMARWKKE